MDKHERKHLKRLSDIKDRLLKRYNTAIDGVGRAFISSKILKNKVYSIHNDAVFNRKVDALLKELSQSITQDIIDDVALSFEASKEKNISLVSEYNPDKKLTDAQMEEILLTSNTKALDAFKLRNVGGLPLSRRVWRYTKSYKLEIEANIIDAINNGMNANQLAKQLQNNLKEPDKLFRRVRDADGVLKSSKSMLNYKSGQGVYKSSFKNALRLARTEVNIAYRTADQQTWQNTPFIKGFKVELSKNHKTYDICDVLKGEYPKNFKWTGWHPQCICRAVPILPNSKEYNVWEDAYLQGVNLELKQVATNPNLKEWLSQNKKRIKGWKSIPYFIRDNNLLK